ncbi:PQQ-dependent sugar dehydrogenase [Patescibacteria group bacterium]|nr:PQQ-dependent sugar dehydrogenase [Patescibacteria group bacterium]
MFNIFVRLKNNKFFSLIVLLGLVFLLAGLFWLWLSLKPTPTFLPAGDVNIITGVKEFNNPVKATAQPTEALRVVAENLEIPWEIAVLPNGNLVVTERPGNLVILNSDGSLLSRLKVENVYHHGEGGLLGLALHPDFLNNRWVYLYLTVNQDGPINRIVRYSFDEKGLTDKKIILDNIPGSIYHNGGRIAFGPDGYLYVTTGDATDTGLAQQTDSLAGKILRLTDIGGVPADNPFGNLVYSYGHRNPQGLVWDNLGRLWATEHGRSGLQSGFDELNLIKAGQNYGWPDSQGDLVKPGTVGPVVHSGAKETWAPAGLTWYKDSLIFVGLRGQSVYRVTVDVQGSLKDIKHYLRQEFGRLRAITANDKGIYITTSNRDGRGQAGQDDDKIIFVDSDYWQ